jgi:hypothetical protein
MVDPGIAAQGTMQLRGTHLDLGTAITLGCGEKTRQRLPEIFSIRHQYYPYTLYLFLSFKRLPGASEDSGFPELRRPRMPGVKLVYTF